MSIYSWGAIIHVILAHISFVVLTLCVLRWNDQIIRFNYRLFNKGIIRTQLEICDKWYELRNKYCVLDENGWILYMVD